MVIAAVTVTGSAIAPSGTPFTGWSWSTTCAVLWAALSVIGLAHLVVGVVRTMPGAGSDEVGDDRG